MISKAVVAVFFPLSVTACLSSGGTTAAEQSSVLVSEMTTICGAVVGDQAEQRINQEWAKYPEAQANRTIIENMAEVLLNDPEATEQQRTSQYKQYMTCATGLLMANSVAK
jgi:basic membrane lipoprotein Med (substrate-binding protein (PBP1-ABC) superfamily)